jgi:aminopeptidase N
MALWIQEVGYPVLTVAEEIDGIGVEQSRFISTGILP